MGSVAFVDIPSVDCGIVSYHGNIKVASAACQSFVVAVCHVHSPFGMPYDAALDALLSFFPRLAISSGFPVNTRFSVFTL